MTRTSTFAVVALSGLVLVLALPSRVEAQPPTSSIA